MAETEKENELLVPLETYLKSGIHLGTKIISPYTRRFVYKRRADGLAVINTKLIDKRLKLAGKFLAKYAPEKIVIIGKRESSWRALDTFSKVIGIRVFGKKYPAGIVTNPSLETFFEPEVFIIIDPWLDKNAMIDALKIRIPVVALCDTNNVTNNIDVIIPCNNKSAKSIGLVFHILAKEYTKNRGMKVEVPELNEFTGEEETPKPEEKKEEKKQEKKIEKEGEKAGVKEEKKTRKKLSTKKTEKKEAKKEKGEKKTKKERKTRKK